MCLAIPGQVVRWVERQPPFCEAEVDFLGVRRVCNLSCVPEAREGDYVIVHAGVAISLVDTKAAEQLLSQLSQPEVFEELGGDQP
ncbi:MAG: HypC/HybG/HupF family hydrogenase formation chaperone [Pirellulaceae bacterium]|nr:HypC/HybG/HupF family hydrogenase formation chaperone [Pirellulaceae bacterium]